MGNLFGSKKGVGNMPDSMPPKKGVIDNNYQELTTEVDTYASRLRILEEHTNNLRRKLQLTDQNLIQTHKKLMDEIRLVNNELSDMRRDINDVKDKIKLIIKELSDCARKQDVDILKKYIEMWEPVNFVTRSELQKILDEYSENIKNKRTE